MALGQFGSLTYSKNNSEAYNYSFTNDFAVNTLLKGFGKVKLASNTQQIMNQDVTEKPLENTNTDGGLTVLS